MKPETSGPPKWPPVIKRVVQTVDRYRMFRANEKVLVGVSGGPDSMALLHILLTLAPHYQLDLAVAHLNHGLRLKDADNDEFFVKEMCEKFELPIFCQRTLINTKEGSVEERARKARYTFFDEIMRRHGYTKIALGHQKNDNAEAVLMHLLRGSGIRGMAGIPPVRQGRVVRPLIHLERTEIMAHLDENKIPFVMDMTNSDPTFDRNRIRHHLIPLLKKDYCANIIDVLARSADLCREEDDWLIQHLRPMLDRAVSQSNEGGLKLKPHVLEEQPLAVKRRLIREALKGWQGHLRRIGACHIEALIALLPTCAEGKRISLPFGIMAWRSNTDLCFGKGRRTTPPAGVKPRPYCYNVGDENHFPQTIKIPEYGCRLIFNVYDDPTSIQGLLKDRDRAWFDLDELSCPLRIRNFEPGDRIEPYGMRGTQKLKKLFIDRKIDIALKHRMALLECGETILWVVGLRRSNRALVSGKTRRILGVQVVWSS